MPLVDGTYSIQCTDHGWKLLRQVGHNTETLEHTAMENELKERVSTLDYYDQYQSFRVIIADAIKRLDVMPNPKVVEVQAEQLLRLAIDSYTRSIKSPTEVPASISMTAEEVTRFITGESREVSFTFEVGVADMESIYRSLSSEGEEKVRGLVSSVQTELLNSDISPDERSTMGTVDDVDGTLTRDEPTKAEIERKAIEIGFDEAVQHFFQNNPGVEMTEETFQEQLRILEDIEQRAVEIGSRSAELWALNDERIFDEWNIRNKAIEFGFDQACKANDVPDLVIDVTRLRSIIKTIHKGAKSLGHESAMEWVRKVEIERLKLRQDLIDAFVENRRNGLLLQLLVTGRNATEVAPFAEQLCNAFRENGLETRLTAIVSNGSRTVSFDLGDDGKLEVNTISSVELAQSDRRRVAEIVAASLMFESVEDFLKHYAIEVDDVIRPDLPWVRLTANGVPEEPLTITITEDEREPRVIEDGVWLFVGCELTQGDSTEWDFVRFRQVPERLKNFALEKLCSSETLALPPQFEERNGTTQILLNHADADKGSSVKKFFLTHVLSQVELESLSFLQLEMLWYWVRELVVCRGNGGNDQTLKWNGRFYPVAWSNKNLAKNLQVAYWTPDPTDQMAGLARVVKKSAVIPFRSISASGVRRGMDYLLTKAPDKEQLRTVRAA